ncbi:unnamed protein product [Blepharisma stoltei]|uniref:Transmembrane protein n=1 Tax=Blepharisma stoltei TaxID=1481888 RepID=A0AAU9IGM0_9CILI|nr:unnamed protein product [Blepharisma stoltei]
MKISFILLFFLYVSVAQEENFKFLKEKASACIKLARLKMIEEKDDFDRLFKDVPKELEERYINRVIGDIILECAEKIAPEEAIDIIEKGEKVKYLPKHKQLMTWSEGPIDLQTKRDYTTEQLIIFQEIVDQTNEMKKAIGLDEDDQPVENRKQKLAACFVLARFIVREDLEEITKLLEKYPKLSKERGTNKILGDILEKCVYGITNEDTFQILEEKENASVLPQYRKFLEWDRNQFEGISEISYTKKQHQIFKELVDAHKKLSENKYQQDTNEDTTSPQEYAAYNFGWGYVMIIIFIFSAVFYFLIKNVIAENKRNEKKKSDKKKKNK